MKGSGRYFCDVIFTVVERLITTFAKRKKHIQNIQEKKEMKDERIGKWHFL